MDIRHRQTRNQILACLQPGDFARIQPYLVRVDLPVRKQLAARDRPIKHVYFLESGLASIIVQSASHEVEAGIIGREGFVGFPVALEVDHSVHEVFVQVAGIGWRCEAAELRKVLAGCPSLRHALLQFVHVTMVQMAFTGLANARFGVDERLARWLLMAHDRVDEPWIRLTHEFLSLMLGTRRPGVTAALTRLENRGLIAMRRGEISIADRTGLEEATNGAYGAPEAEYARLFGEAAP